MPFNFNILADKEEKARLRVLYSCTAVLLMAAFTVGFMTVYVNSYNMISSVPMEVFSFYKSDDSIGFIFFDHFFGIWTR